MKELPEYENNEYVEHCDNCGERHSMFTQSDNCPEYYTQVALRCPCGEYVMFNLPVN